MKKNRKEVKKSDKNIPDQSSSSPDEAEKKRRSSLTDTPITSSSSEGMASNDFEPSTSASAAAKKKRKGRKKSEAEAMITTMSATMQPFSPVYSSANNVNTTSSVWTSPTISTPCFDHGMSVANCNLNVVLNNHRPSTQFDENKWLAELRGHLNDGNAKAFFCGIRFLCLMLCRGSGRHREKSREELIRFVMENVVTRYYDSNQQVTVFMSLSSYASKRCSEVDHGYCRIMRTLFKHISPQFAKKQLAIVSKMQGRTALHMALDRGEICQVRVLMEYEVPVGIEDRRCNTELYFALNNKDLEKVKHLLWYGADFSQVVHGNYNEKPLIVAQAVAQHEIFPWLADRTAALNRKFHGFVTSLSRDMLVIKETLSDLHTVRLSPPYDAQQQYSRFQPPDPVARSFTVNIRENYEQVGGKWGTAVMFVIPLCYNDTKDVDSPADLPWLARTGLFVSSIDGSRRPLNLFPMNPILYTPEETVVEMAPAISPSNNGHMFCFRMPDKLVKRPYILSAHFDTNGLEAEKLRTTLLGVQVFRVVPAEVDLKKIN